MKNSIFKQNPNLEKVFGTADGEFFYGESDAKNHAKSLEDKTIEIVLNENCLEAVSEDVEDDDLSGDVDEEGTGENSKNADGLDSKVKNINSKKSK